MSERLRELARAFDDRVRELSAPDSYVSKAEAQKLVERTSIDKPIHACRMSLTRYLRDVVGMSHPKALRASCDAIRDVDSWRVEMAPGIGRVILDSEMVSEVFKKLPRLVQSWLRAHASDAESLVKVERSTGPVSSTWTFTTPSGTVSVSDLELRSFDA